ncbi:Short-chain dehydrogenase/reductase SDR [Candidatus Rhodobacter oscarellae]|uniref:Short-chain dehydrogenase/reductase SDR n=1 Tax=Candidatus Rhodobacter oscarellae TaxID=1675527 RepID=A0A0J9H3V6_9RHOB|nr:SDR family NAD(P)-dependent oxidoreductase [Candidatus Rhodobacter lobularis]KMW60363.1 Short-chain dehydrogenase/reductase SDR [Candidatus Rhodobacter lobularis]
MRALIIGASGGIGAGLCGEAARRGYAVTALSRSGDGLDVTDGASVEAHLGGLEGPFELILVATGALEVTHPPEKSLRALTAEALVEQFVINALGPAMVLRHAARLLPRDRRAVFAALSARVGSIGDNRLGGWTSYRASKAALNQILRTASIEIARTHKEAIVAALHPGTVATPFTAKYVAAEKATPPGEAAAMLLDVCEGLTQTGGFFDYAGKPVPW